jgi:hypothetical protein
MDGPTRLRLVAELPDVEARLKALRTVLAALAAEPKIAPGPRQQLGR